MGNFKWGERSLKRAEGVKHLLVECGRRALLKSKYDGTVAPYGGVRSAEEQFELYIAKRSKADGTIKLSNHQHALALDVIHVSGEYESKRAKKFFRHFAKCMFNAWQDMLAEGVPSCEDYYLEHGAHWINFIDAPHWQLTPKNQGTT